MKENEKKTEKPEQEAVPALSPDFFRNLLTVPPCKLGKPCNDCGQCEH